MGNGRGWGFSRFSLWSSCAEGWPASGETSRAAATAFASVGTTQTDCAPGRNARTIQTGCPSSVVWRNPSTSNGAPCLPFTSASMARRSSGSLNTPRVAAGGVFSLLSGCLISYAPLNHDDLCLALLRCALSPVCLSLLCHDFILQGAQ